MDNKKLGIIILIIGIVLASTILIVKIREDSLIRKIAREQGVDHRSKSDFTARGLVEELKLMLEQSPES